ncbi:hypothetical protein ScalyP_jg9834 [Parmales sp. scaly parma]|nr:hypothetical protein ScalyP_jg9834 [Parmales sp. scaly parma]
MSSFTVFALLPSCTLSKSSLPLLIPSEIQISTIEQTELRLYSHPSALESSTSKAPKLTELGQRSSPDLTLTLTTHRLIFATKNGECCVYFPLSSINLKSTKSHSSALASAANATTCITTNITITPSLTIHKRNAHFGRSPKIHFETKSNYLAAEVVVKFDSTRGNVERDDLYDDVVRAVGRKGWEKDEGAIGEGVDSFENIFIHLENKNKPPSKTTSSAGHAHSAANHNQAYVPTSSGIAGIMRKQKQKHRQENTLTNSAFTGDLESLMDKARDVVKIIEKYTDDGSDGDDGSSSDEVKSLLEKIGVTQYSATLSRTSSTFHTTLARLLADFLRPILRKTPSVTLPEIYCLFNRSRGMQELISPSDLLESCKIMKSLELGMELKTFRSGVLVVSEDGRGDEAVAERLVEMCREKWEGKAKSGVNEVEVGEFFNVGQVLAREFLIRAEESGKLARDDTTRGIFYFENLFEKLKFPLTE